MENIHFKVTGKLICVRGFKIYSSSLTVPNILKIKDFPKTAVGL